MSHSDRVLIDLTARCPLVELVLLDNDMAEVLRGVGRIQSRLPVGIYELYATIGATTKTEIIPLRSDLVIDDYEVEFATVTPADGQVAELAASLSRAVSEARSPGATGLTIVRADTTHVVEVIDSTGDVVGDDGTWTHAVVDGWVAWSCTRPLGAHRLRYHSDDGVDDVPIWLSPGWQAVVFIPAYCAELSTAATVVHMVPMDRPWQPEPNCDLLLEAMLDSGQRLQPPLPDDFAQVVRSRVDRPMVILAAAALALQCGHPDLPALVDHVVRLLPDNPDACALRFAVDNASPQARFVPMFATVYYRVLLAADHDGQSAISPASPLSEAVLDLAVAGPYLLQTPEPIAISAWLAAHVPGRSHDRGTRHPLATLAEHADVTAFARAAGLTRHWARQAMTLLHLRSDSSLVSHLTAIGSEFNLEQRSFTAPGMRNWVLPRLRLNLRCERIQASSVIRLLAEAGTLPKTFPLLVSAPDEVNCLLEVANGRAEWRTDSRGPFELRWPEVDQVGELPAFEALAFAPTNVPSFSSDREPVRGRAVVPSGRFRMDTYEDENRNVELAVVSDHMQDAGAFALLVVRTANQTVEKLVVPLSWMKSQKVASGTVRVGRVDEEMKVLVVPELQRSADLDLGTVRRSLVRSADDATTLALREVEATLVAASR